MNESVHMGNIVHRWLTDNRRSVAWLAEQIHCDRHNLCRVLKRPYLGDERLWHISNALKTDFFEYYSTALHNKINREKKVAQLNF